MAEKIIIKDKMESIEAIKNLDLNKFSEELFERGQEKDILKFIVDNPAQYYAIRDKSRAGGTFKLKVEKDNIIDEIKDYDLFTINVSSANYVENQLLVGEISIMSNGDVYATLSTNGSYSVRDALRNPDINIKTDIFDDETLNKIPSFNTIYTYIIDNNLKDLIVEFAIFDIPVGIKNENVIIYELRTDY